MHNFVKKWLFSIFALARLVFLLYNTIENLDIYGNGGRAVKNLSLLVWLSQLGLSVALPLGGFILLGVWLHNRFNWGSWVIIVCAVIGVICAIDGLRTSLKAMSRMAKEDKKEQPPVSFNDHD